MITNFEEITKELNEVELQIIPILVRSFNNYTQQKPIKAPEIVKGLNEYLGKNNYKIKMTEARLRKCCNYIRSNSIIPLIATSDGYYVSNDKQIIESQIKSLTQRANSILKCANGLRSFINPNMGKQTNQSNPSNRTRIIIDKDTGEKIDYNTGATISENDKKVEQGKLF